MKKTIALFKIMLDSTYGISSFKYKASKNHMEVLKFIGLMLILVVSLSPMLLGYIVYIESSYKGLQSYGAQGAVITLGVVLSSTLILILGLFYVISTFYFTSDMEHLITLPLRPAQILGAKFGVVLVSEYITELFIVLPPIIIYGIGEGAGVLYWIYALIGILIIPVIPLCIISMIAIVVMRVTNIGKKRDLYRTIGSLVVIFALMGIQFYIQNVAERGGIQKISNMLFSESGLINVIASAYPPAAWISKALIQSNGINGLVMLLFFLAASAVFLILFEYLGEKFFIGGYMGSGSVEAKRKRITDQKFVKETASKSKVMAVFWREFNILNRVPVFFINNVFIIVMVPFMFLMMYFLSPGEEMNELVNIIRAPRGIYIASLVAAGIAIFTAAANMTPSTSLSREGAQFFVSKYIPVSPHDQILGKVLHSFALISVGDLLASFTVGFIIRLPLIHLLTSFLISAAASWAIIEIGLMIDLTRPLLVWDNPQKAVKQNLNGVISMFFNALWPGLSLFATGRLISNPVFGYTLLLVLFLALDIIMYKVLMSYAQKRYADIEP